MNEAIQDLAKFSQYIQSHKESLFPNQSARLNQKIVEACCCQLLQHRSAYKQSHAHHPFGWLAIKLNRVVHWTPVPGDQSA